MQKQHTLQNCVHDFANQRCWHILWQSYSEFDEVLRIRREVDKKIGEITSAVQVHSCLSWVYIYLFSCGNKIIFCVVRYIHCHFFDLFSVWSKQTNNFCYWSLETYILYYVMYFAIFQNLQLSNCPLQHCVKTGLFCFFNCLDILTLSASCAGIRLIAGACTKDLNWWRSSGWV